MLISNSKLDLAYKPLQMEESNPPFETTYKALFEISQTETDNTVVEEECELPLIDLNRLNHHDGTERESCMGEIARASSLWGFFQVVNHGISHEILQKTRHEQIKVFRQPFEKKTKEKLFDFPANSYRWGTPTAGSLKQFSWSEAFHIPLAEDSNPGGINTFRETIQEFAVAVSGLAQRLAQVLSESLGFKTSYFAENCTTKTCYVRLNRYPPCSISNKEVFGLMPHTDSDFLTIVHQDEVGGLQLMKDGRWVTVKPNPEALIINIGDLLQAWSNGAYKSVEHRVIANREVERFSMAYFLCPSYNTVIESCRGPFIYRKFSFGEFRRQVQEDVRTIGHKVGLPRFLIKSRNLDDN